MKNNLILILKSNYLLFFRVSQYITTGIIEHQLKAVTRGSDKCMISNIPKDNNQFRQLTFEDYNGVFTAFISGCVLGFTYFSIEMMRNLIFYLCKIIL